MGKMQITPELVGMTGSIIGLVGWLYKLSGKYYAAIHQIENDKSDILVLQKTIADLMEKVGGQASRLLTIENNFHNLKDNMVVKSDITRLEAEMDHLKSNVHDIKHTLKDFMLLTTTQYQDISRHIGKIEGLYSELKDLLKVKL